MNIFYLDSNIHKCAEAHVDSHVRKMILEYTQLLSAAYYQDLENVWKSYNVTTKKTIIVVRNPGQPQFQIYAKTHFNHPSAVWTRQSIHHWKYIHMLALALCVEFEYRWGKKHATEEVLVGMIPPTLPDIPFVQPPQAMDEVFKSFNSIDAYRNYYRGGKKHLHQYTRREVPEWLKVSL